VAVDSTFAEAWQKVTAPFDGVTVFLPELLWLPAVRLALVAVVDRLEALRPNSTLLRNDDWHDHDGYVSEAAAFSWAALRAYLASEEALQGANRGDFAVRLGVFPQERDWYLRILVTTDPFGVGCPEGLPAPPAEELPPFGTWDLTGSESVAATMEQDLRGRGYSPARMPAKQFFDQHDGSRNVFRPGDPLPPELFNR
jgi:hypothetical protein